MGNDILNKISTGERGSIWQQWDLHIHTPSSYDYLNGAVTNKEIVNTLVKQKVVAVAITDHHLIDVNRITKLKNLAGDKLTIFPGIEFKSELGGSQSIHFIGIFPEDINVEDLWRKLEVKLELTTEEIRKRGGDEKLFFDLKDTTKIIKSHGGIVTIHAGKKSNSIENITNALPSKEAVKEDIVKSIDMYEVASAKDLEEYKEAVFPNINKFVPTICCSDNHNTKEYALSERCWVKAKPTFYGLKQAILEPESRIFLGELPPIIEYIDQNKTKYIDKLSINQKEDYDEKNGVWFKNVEISFNPELTVVIGNKGTGKSAVSDTLGLLGNTDNSNDFSFLTSKKFLRRGFAENFIGKLTWLSDDSIEGVELNSEVGENTVPRVKYLPQSYFENLCNDLESSNFEAELQSVIFKHLDEEEQLSARTFEQLVQFKSQSVKKELSKAKNDLQQINKDIFHLEEKLHLNHIEKLNNNLSQINNQISNHKKIKPKPVKNPAKDKLTEEKEKKLQERIGKLNDQIVNVSTKINKKRKRRIELAEENVMISHFESAIDQMEQGLSDILKEYSELIGKLQKSKPETVDFLTLTYNSDDLEDYSSSVKSDIEKIDLSLVATKQEVIDKDLEKKTGRSSEDILKSSLIVKQNSLLSKKTGLTEKLSLPYKKYEKYREKLKQWKDQLEELDGRKEKPEIGTKSYFVNEISYLEKDGKSDLVSLRNKRNEQTKKIYALRHKIIEIFGELKKSISKITQANEKLLEHYSIEIVANFRYSYKFIQYVSDSINKGIAGFFYRDSDNKKLNETFKEINLEDPEEIVSSIENLIDHLEGKGEDGKQNHIHDQVKVPMELYDYLFGLEYLEERYELNLNDKPLEILSPGERGALLLVFYLMIDDEDIPLIIDQPEDNLDNKSVYEILVHFIREAKKKRQIILVTHNPNLAVGADAEEVIYVRIDKSDKNKFSFIAGGIESPKTNELLVDVLEGTMAAFNLRKLTYIKSSNP